ncbi:MAG: helix-turn-helix transcriptional regulator [Patescibacteria group bacterium]
MGYRRKKECLMPEDLDLHLGRRLKKRRRELKLNQTQLGERVGMRFQQIQKYEHGKSRMSVGRLWQFAEVLDVPMSYFYEGFVHIPAPPSRRFVHVSQKDVQPSL